MNGLINRERKPMTNGINKIPMNQRKDNRFWKFVMGDDLDFYEEYTIHLTDEEQEKFFEENPDFLCDYPISRDKMYLLRDVVFRGILRKIKKYEEGKRL